LRAYLSTTGDDKYVGTSGGGGGGGGGDNKDPHPTNFILKKIKNYYGDDNEGKSLVPPTLFYHGCTPVALPPRPPSPLTTTTTTNTK
jgi:hypothetical protein